MGDLIQRKTASGQTGTAGDCVASGGGQSGIELRAAQAQTIMEKLSILTDAAKYDVACTSSGVDRKGNGRDMGSCVAAGICHSFSADGNAFPSSRSFLRTNAFMIVNIALTAGAMMCRAQLSRRMRSVS